MCLWVTGRGRDLKQWAAAKSKMYIKKQIGKKKSPEEWEITKQACRDESVVFSYLQYLKKQIYIPQKLTYLSAKRGFFCPFFLTSRHGSYRKRILQTETTETTHLFFPATSWKWHSSRLHNCLLCLSSLRRSRDVKTDIWIFNILNSIFLIYLSILYIYLIHLFTFSFFLFSAVRRPPSVSSFYRHP